MNIKETSKQNGESTFKIPSIVYFIIALLFGFLIGIIVIANDNGNLVKGLAIGAYIVIVGFSILISNNHFNLTFKQTGLVLLLSLFISEVFITQYVNHSEGSVTGLVKATIKKQYLEDDDDPKSQMIRNIDIIDLNTGNIIKQYYRLPQDKYDILKHTSSYTAKREYIPFVYYKITTTWGYTTSEEKLTLK